MRRPEPRSGQERAEDQGDREVPGRPVLRSVPCCHVGLTAPDGLSIPRVQGDPEHPAVRELLTALLDPEHPAGRALRERLRSRAVPADPEAE